MLNYQIGRYIWKRVLVMHLCSVLAKRRDWICWEAYPRKTSTVTWRKSEVKSFAYTLIPSLWKADEGLHASSNWILQGRFFVYVWVLFGCLWSRCFWMYVFGHVLLSLIFDSFYAVILERKLMMTLFLWLSWLTMCLGQEYLFPWVSDLRWSRFFKMSLLRLQRSSPSVKMLHNVVQIDI